MDTSLFIIFLCCLLFESVRPQASPLTFSSAISNALNQTNANLRGSKVDEFFKTVGWGPFVGQLFMCLKSNNSDYKREFEVHYYGKPTAFITTKSVGKVTTDLVDPYRESEVYHEYLLIGPGYATVKHANEIGTSDEFKAEIVSEEEIQLIIYDEDGLHSWEVIPNLEQHNLAKEHVWALINATGMLPSMTVSNTTFQKTFRFHANEGDKIAYHLSYPHLFRSKEPAPPMDVLIEFPANTRTLRTLKTMIDYQTFSLLRWRLSPAELVTDPKLTVKATRAETVTFQDFCSYYINEELVSSDATSYLHPRYITCTYQRRLKWIHNPCIKDMFVLGLILDYDVTERLSTSQLMIAVPMVFSLGSKGSEGWINLTDVYCPSDLVPEECGEPLDVVLTNGHLIILTDKGLWISNNLDATNTNASIHYKLKPMLKFTPTDPCGIFSDFNCSEVGTPILGHNSIRRHRLFYTPVCHLYQYPHFEDIVIYVIDHVTQSEDLLEERDAYTVLYATNKGDYRYWKVLFQAEYQYETSSGPMPIKELISIFFNHHRRLFDITLLLHDKENELERTFRFVLPEPKDEDFKGYKNLSGLLGRGFLEHEFPPYFGMTHLQVNTETMDVYFIGNQLWIAEAGNSFLYESVPKVYDHNGNESRLNDCAFNHPDRSFLCAELTHAEIYVGRVGVSYAPTAIKFSEITEFKYTAIYRYWPEAYLYYIGLHGHFAASYSGKIVLWFVPDYFIMYKSLVDMKDQINQGVDCDFLSFGESPMSCLLCKKMKTLITEHKCEVLDLQRFENTAQTDFSVEFPTTFEMLSFDPTKFKTRDTSTHGPLVPFPIDGDKVVVFEAEVPDLEQMIPQRSYLSPINVGNRIICHGHSAELSSNETRCNEVKHTHTDCELYIRHMKNLKRHEQFGFIQGFRHAFYATVVKSFPVWPIPCDVIVVILKDSNKAIIQLDTGMFDETRNGEYMLDYSHVGMTLYVPQHFSILLTGFPKYKVADTDGQCTNTQNSEHDFTRIAGVATRYYRLGTRVHVKPFRSFLIKFPTEDYCKRYVRSIDKSQANCTGDLTAMEYEAHIKEMDDKWQETYKNHMSITESVSNNLFNALMQNGTQSSAKSNFFEQVPPDDWRSYRDYLNGLLSLPGGPSVGELQTQKLLINETFKPEKLRSLSEFKCDINRWSIIDGGCHLQLILDKNLVITQNGGRISLDKHDSISFTMKLRALSPREKKL